MQPHLCFAISFFLSIFGSIICSINSPFASFMFSSSAAGTSLGACTGSCTCIHIVSRFHQTGFLIYTRLHHVYRDIQSVEND